MRFITRHRNPVEEIAEQPVVFQESESTAEKAVNGCGRERHEVMQHHTEYLRAGSSVDGLPADQPSRNQARVA